MQRYKRPPIIQRAKEDPLRRGVNIVPNISVGWFIPSILCNLVASFSKINGLTSSIFTTKNDIVTDHHFIERLKKIRYFVIVKESIQLPQNIYI